jgi:hypothetical protein
MYGAAYGKRTGKVAATSVAVGVTAGVAAGPLGAGALTTDFLAGSAGGFVDAKLDGAPPEEVAARTLAGGAFGATFGAVVRTGSGLFSGEGVTVVESNSVFRTRVEPAIRSRPGAGALVDEPLPPSGGTPPAQESTRIQTTVGNLRSAELRDAHHVIQDAAVRDLPGYQTELAPGTQLPGPSNVPGTPHYEATQVQRQAGGGTYGAERRIAYKALRMAGFSDAGARAEIARADQYFQSIGVTPQTPTRIPGNRN